ncbi:MAG: surface-adhesin E family protein [Saezia sp.]
MKKLTTLSLSSALAVLPLLFLAPLAQAEKAAPTVPTTWVHIDTTTYPHGSFVTYLDTKSITNNAQNPELIDYATILNIPPNPQKGIPARSIKLLYTMDCKNKLFAPTATDIYEHPDLKGGLIKEMTLEGNMTPLTSDYPTVQLTYPLVCK